MQTIFSKAEEVRNSQQRAAICIVIETKGSTPRKQGSKMIVYDDGTIFGSIGGGTVEKEVAEKTVELIALGRPVKCSFNLENDLSPGVPSTGNKANHSLIQYKVSFSQDGLTMYVSK